ncbi:MAG: DUF2807 domain-containing protein [Burkholderiaceae bacterium]
MNKSPIKRRRLALAGLSCLVGAGRVLVPASAMLAIAGPAMAAMLETRELPLAAFDRIATDVPAQIRVVSSQSAGITMTGEKKVLDALSAKVVDGQLQLVATGSYQTKEKLSIEIRTGPVRVLHLGGGAIVSFAAATAKGLEATLGGAAQLTLESLNLETLGLDIKGSAGVVAAGKGQSLTLKVVDAARFDGEQLPVQRASVAVSGSANALVRAERELRATADDAGTIEYLGNPELLSKTSGVGSIQKI